MPKKTIAEISHERRNGYSWLGTYAAELLQKHYPLWKKNRG
ncbi:MAG: pectate lyase [Dehalococcoidia bacterium]|nr:pectate lyase [Dehalococcoidia bacterium]